MSSPKHQVPLPSWPHSRDTLTVWKRHSFCSIQYDDDDDDDSDDNEADEKGNEGDKDAKAQGKEPGEKGKKTSPKGGSGDGHGAEGTGRKGGEKGEGSGKEGSDGDYDSDESRSSSGPDDFGSIEGLPIGMLDVDMYAFVPEDERMPCAQAAPCARFLLDAEP